MISTLVTLFLVGLAAVFVLGLIMAVLGAVFHATIGLAGFLLFKVLPILLIGYLVVRFLAPKRRPATDDF